MSNDLLNKIDREFLEINGCISKPETDNALECYNKIDNTLCLNSLLGSLQFNIDQDDCIDCRDIEEMVKCLDAIKKDLIKANEYEELMEEYGITNIREAFITARMFEGDSEADLKRQSRALDIINENNVDIRLLKQSFDVYDYNTSIGNSLYDFASPKKLTAKEFEQVKRYIKNN